MCLVEVKANVMGWKVKVADIRHKNSKLYVIGVNVLVPERSGSPEQLGM